MKPYGWNSQVSKGYRCVCEDICTKGNFHGGKKHQSKRRKSHQRIFKKLERNYNKQVIKQQIKEMNESESIS